MKKTLVLLASATFALFVFACQTEQKKTAAVKKYIWNF
jgi:hypothetical protein